MDLIPILHAALRATGTDPHGREYSFEEAERAQKALRAVDVELDRALGWTTLASITIGTPKTGIERIAAERKRQVEAEGWTPDHDDLHRSAELAQAAAAYVLNCCDDSDGPELRFMGADLWPWPDFWKPSSD